MPWVVGGFADVDEGWFPMLAEGARVRGGVWLVFRASRIGYRPAKAATAVMWYWIRRAGSQWFDGWCGALTGACRPTGGIVQTATDGTAAGKRQKLGNPRWINQGMCCHCCIGRTRACRSLRAPVVSVFRRERGEIGPGAEPVCGGVVGTGDCAG